MRPAPLLLAARCAGFTMLELVIVILIAGILSFAAVGRLNDTGEVNAHGFAEQIASTVRFAQEAAVSQRRPMYVNVNTGSGTVSVCLDASVACVQPLAAPGGGNLGVQAPGGVALTTNTAQFSFDGLGQPSVGAQVQIQVTAPDSQQFLVTVEPGSGYVRRS
jgi:prepilin-type N-terminal cleavage/methylation domain-containing protein